MNGNLFFATMKEGSQLVIRQCKFTKLIVRPNCIRFRADNGMALEVNQDFLDYEIVFAGLDLKVKSLYDLNTKGIKIYKTYEAAKNNDSNELLIYSYDSSPLIHLESFNLHVYQVTAPFAFVSESKTIGYGYTSTKFKLQFFSYYWNGTKAVRRQIHYRFKFDVLNMAGDTESTGGSDEELNLGELYKTAELCENDNAIKVYAFP